MLRRGYTTVRDAGGAGHAFKVAVEQGLVQGRACSCRAGR